MNWQTLASVMPGQISFLNFCPPAFCHCKHAVVPSKCFDCLCAHGFSQQEPVKTEHSNWQMGLKVRNLNKIVEENKQANKKPQRGRLPEVPGRLHSRAWARLCWRKPTHGVPRGLLVLQPGLQQPLGQVAWEHSWPSVRGCGEKVVWERLGRRLGMLGQVSCTQAGNSLRKLPPKHALGRPQPNLVCKELLISHDLKLNHQLEPIGSTQPSTVPGGKSYHGFRVF